MSEIMQTPSLKKSRARVFYARARAFLFYVVFVVLWGAFVRATGSGAGCGSHWPLCNGEVVPRAPQIQTVIEFSHRLTSGLCLVFAIALYLSSRRVFKPGHPVRGFSLAAGIFVVIEALIGAAIVLYEWVAKDTSISRAVSVGAHLVNTFLLFAALTVTTVLAYAASGEGQDANEPLDIERVKISRDHYRLAIIGFVGLLFVGAAGALTALGDTLFPVGRTLVQDHFLVRLRTLHPFLALLMGTYLFLVSLKLAAAPMNGLSRFCARAHSVVVMMGMALGALTILLQAPVYMQMIHLLFADLIVITFVGMWAGIFYGSTSARPRRN